MTANIGVRFLSGNHQKVLSVSLLRPSKYSFCSGKSLRAGIASIGVVVKVAKIDNVDAEPSKYGTQVGLKSKCPGHESSHSTPRWKVSGDGLEAGNRLVDVVVGVGHDRLLRG